MTTSALKKPLLADEQLQDDRSTPVKSPALPETPPVKLMPVGTITCESFSSPGHGWECIRQPQLGAHIRKGLFQYNPHKGQLGELTTAKAWAALNRWRTHPGELPPRPPSQEGVHLKH